MTTPRATCLSGTPCPRARWTTREWGEQVCEVCHPTPRSSGERVVGKTPPRAKRNRS